MEGHDWVKERPRAVLAEMHLVADVINPQGVTIKKSIFSCVDAHSLTGSLLELRLGLCACIRQPLSNSCSMSALLGLA